MKLVKIKEKKTKKHGTVAVMIPVRDARLCKTCEDQLRRPGSAYCVKCAKKYAKRRNK